jgi:hypothetical protein
VELVDVFDPGGTPLMTEPSGGGLLPDEQAPSAIATARVPQSDDRPLMLRQRGADLRPAEDRRMKIGESPNLRRLAAFR